MHKIRDGCSNSFFRWHWLTIPSQWVCNTFYTMLIAIFTIAFLTFAYVHFRDFEFLWYQGSADFLNHVIFNENLGLESVEPYLVWILHILCNPQWQYWILFELPMVDKGDISDLSQMYPFYKGQPDNRTNSGFYTRSTHCEHPSGWPWLFTFELLWYWRKN